jgi:hypothetical protein
MFWLLLSGVWRIILKSGLKNNHVCVSASLYACPSVRMEQQDSTHFGAEDLINLVKILNFIR